MYTAFYNPLSLVFVQTRWAGRLALEYSICALWLVDVLVVKMRTLFKHHGYEIVDVRRVARRYIGSYFIVDFLGCFPFSALFSAAGLDPFDINTAAVLAQLLSLLRTIRVLRMTMRIHGRGATIFQICAMVVGIILLAHLCGLLWYAAAILPLERKLASAGPDDPYPLGMEDWWLDEDDSYSVAIRYVCALYWAFSVMTSLKSNAAHESRQCLYRSDTLIVSLLAL